MRLKIFAIFSVVVLAVAGVAFALTRAAVFSLVAPDASAAPRALEAASAQLQVEGLSTERWLAARAADPVVREPFTAGTAAARAEAATGVADKINEAAASAPELFGVRASLVLLTDAQGVVLGRNGSKQLRGDDLGAAYPSLKAALAAGVHSTDVWINAERNEQLFASFAPVRGADGKVVGAVVFASSITDERLTSASEKTSGSPLALGFKSDKGFELVAKSSAVAGELAASLAQKGASDAALSALGAGKAIDLPGLPAGYTGQARALGGYGDGKRAVLLAISAPPTTGLGSALLWPVLAASVVGLLLAGIVAFLMDAYLSRPVAEIEDGLLAIMNGQTNRRLELEHAVLGGIVFRINSLLNQLFGVTEDDTDEDGRPSRAPSAKGLVAALSVDERVVTMAAIDPTGALFIEPVDAYHKRVFQEYVAAKRGVGDPTDHITFQDFLDRLLSSEAEMTQKHGKPVRFRVEQRDKEVALVAITET
jgi:hypothetical protein